MKLDILNRMYREGIIAIVRADGADGLIQVADAIVAGGVSVLEVTMTTPGARDIITNVVTTMGDRVCIGVGSVLDAETARLAVLAGAQFIVTPVLDVDVIRVGNRYSVPVIMGCYTPTEIKVAWEQGADLIKLFPAVTGGLTHLKAVRAPLPQVAFVPTGGIDLNNANEFLDAGIFALGIGSALVNTDLIKSSDFGEITRRARAFRTIIDQHRLMRFPS